MLRTYFVWFCAILCPFLVTAADRPDNVVAQYHFLGADQLAQNSTLITAHKVFALNSTLDFKNLVLARLSRMMAESLVGDEGQETGLLLPPLLDDILDAESFASFGGASGQPLEFTFALHLDKNRSQFWRRNLDRAFHHTGQELRFGNFSGWQWKHGAQEFWVVSARDWLLVGRGEALAATRNDYLQQIQKTGRPGPTLMESSFEADIDWPRLASWLPLSSCPLKLARTQISVGVKGGTFRVKSRVTYPQAIDWHPQPRRIPTGLVHEPLVAFSTGEDIEPFLKSDTTLDRLSTNPLREQYYFWALGDMPFESYLAWPADNATDRIRQLVSEAPALLNPILKTANGTRLTWAAAANQINWGPLPLIVPTVKPMSDAGSQFLVAGLFPVTPGKGPAPAALFEQFRNKPDVIYYDWELTGLRLPQMRLLTEMLPILPKPDAKKTGQPNGGALMLRPLENWLNGLTPLLGNTVTEATHTGPNEVTVIRNAPLLFTSFELVWLSHWLTATPVGPVDEELLPHRAKITGPGIPPR